MLVEMSFQNTSHFDDLQQNSKISSLLNSSHKNCHQIYPGCQYRLMHPINYQKSYRILNMYFNRIVYNDNDLPSSAAALAR